MRITYSRTDSGAAGVATSEPPLYYALETVPYTLAGGGTVLDRLALMRLLSALMGGLTALFVYLFLREALPGSTVGLDGRRPRRRADTAARSHVGRG